MMHTFLNTHRDELQLRCRAKVAARPLRVASAEQLAHGIPMFLDQLIRTLEAEEEQSPARSIAISGAADGNAHSGSELAASAAIHGDELLALGYSISQVVHDYGDLCQAVTDLAADLGEKFEIDEFRTLNRCLDNGIAEAVTAFNQRRDLVIASTQARDANERLGHFAHELRNLLNTATLATTALKSAGVGMGGATGAVLERSLVGLRTLIDRSLAEVRNGSGATPYRSLFPLRRFIAEVGHSAALEARLFDCALTVSASAPALQLDADADLLWSALGNLLQNAFKFSGRDGHVLLSARAEGAFVRIEVKDSGPGMSAAAAVEMFQPFTQAGTDKTGLGLGLAIARRSVEANGGTLTVESVPGQGCVFAIILRHAGAATPDLA